MKSSGSPELILIFLIGLFLFGGKHLKELAAQLEQAIDNFRGGPRPPSHPLPANDSRLLNRKRVKAPPTLPPEL